MPSQFPRLAIVSTLAFLVAGLAACADEAALAGDDAATVTTTVVREQAFNDTLQAIGTARARESVTITAKVSEVVRDVRFEKWIGRSCCG